MPTDTTLISVITNATTVTTEINDIVAAKFGPQQKKPKPPALVQIEDDRVYNGTLILIFRDALPDLHSGLHETLRQMRFLRAANNIMLSTTLYHVIATTTEMVDDSTVWYSPMGLVKFDEHPYVRDAVRPFAEAVRNAPGRARASSVGEVATPDDAEVGIQPEKRRGR